MMAQAVLGLSFISAPFGGCFPSIPPEHKNKAPSEQKRASIFDGRNNHYTEYNNMEINSIYMLL